MRKQWIVYEICLVAKVQIRQASSLQVSTTMSPHRLSEDQDKINQRVCSHKGLKRLWTNLRLDLIIKLLQDFCSSVSFSFSLL